MNIVFYASDKTRERRLAAAFAAGAHRHGHHVAIKPLGAPLSDGGDIDLVCMVGVKSHMLWRYVRTLGIPTVMFDKGYSRHKQDGCWEYWRIAYKAHQPTAATIRVKYSGDRFKRLKLTVSPWKKPKNGTHILIAGSSAKYHTFYGLPDPTTYARSLVREIRQYSGRPIVYRPKPSWKGAGPIPGTTFSQGKRPLALDLEDCHVLVTHGSNACYEATLNGTPSIVLGEGVVKSISSTKLSRIERPLRGHRPPVFNALAYHQWTLAEMAEGTMFDVMRRWF